MTRLAPLFLLLAFTSPALPSMRGAVSVDPAHEAAGALRTEVPIDLLEIQQA